MSVPFEDLANACRTLFGPGTVASPEFVEYLRPPGLKAAFRSLAKNNHPDRAGALSIEASLLAAKFRLIRAAYELLLPYVERRKQVPRPAPVARASCQCSSTAWRTVPPPPRQAWSMYDRFYSGPLPDQALRLGEFLYYTRRIAWRELIAAVVWQANHRPRLGELALERGWIRADDICLLRRHARAHELWGETATRLGVLSGAQLRLLLGWQRMYGRAIGRYFVNAGILTEGELAALVVEQHLHNLRFAAAPTCKLA